MNSLDFDLKLYLAKINWVNINLGLDSLEKNGEIGYNLLTFPLIILTNIYTKELIIDYIEYYRIYIKTLIFIKSNWEDFLFSHLENEGSVLFHDMESEYLKIQLFLINHQIFIDSIDVKLNIINSL